MLMMPVFYTLAFNVYFLKLDMTQQENITSCLFINTSAALYYINVFLLCEDKTEKMSS